MYSYECHCTFPFRYFLAFFITILSGVGIPVGGEVFRSRPDRPWGPPSLPYNGYRVSFGGGGVNLPRRGVEHTHPSTAEVKESVKL